MSLNAPIVPESQITNPNISYIETIMKNVKNHSKFNYVVSNTQTTQVLNNNNQNNVNRHSIYLPIGPENINNKKKEITLIKNTNANIQISTPFEEITYDSYFKSNLLSLLYYFKTYKYDIKIVCHSHVMQDLLNIKILNNFKTVHEDKKTKILEIENNDNIWSIILNSGKYCITRHAFTMANLYKEKAKNSKIPLLSLAKFKQVTDIDTKLSLYGILGTLDFKNDAINLNECNNTVFVSVLVRTWITAICLYLSKIGDNKQFTLVVSPFIKESGKTYDNKPLLIQEQINIIKNFLLFLRNIDTTKVSAECNTSIQLINNFFNNDGELVINGEKLFISGKNKLLRNIKRIKNVKYTIKYDSVKQCFITTQTNTENFFKSLISNISSYNLNITDLTILPGLRKPTKEMIKKHSNINKEPLNKSKIIKINNCESKKNIKIGIIDIDEEEKEFTSEQIKHFYNKNKSFFEDKNIIVVCSQNSLSQGSTKHFQHLLKELFIETNNTNFNLKNKKNTTQVFPSKFLSPISSSKSGLRTRVYTQGLHNDKLNVDFSATSSKEGAILCSIKYDGEQLIKVLNSYVIDVNKSKIENIITKISSKIPYSRNTIFIGKLEYKDFYIDKQKNTSKNITILQKIKGSNIIDNINNNTKPLVLGKTISAINY